MDLAANQAHVHTSEVAASGAPRRAAPLLAMGAGLAIVALAATVLVSGPGGGDTAPRTTPVVTTEPEPATAALSTRDVSVVSQVYEPGEDSGWHAHSGVHAVTVLSGVLTIYDGQCRATTFEPGQPYVGGQELHLARNETPVPVVMAVTYVSPSNGGAPTRRLPAPAGC